MIRVSTFIVLAALTAWSSPALAGAADYTFELVKSELPKGNDVPVQVRLVNKKTGQPVEGAVIIRSRLDMAPEGMAQHVTGIKADAADKPGVYAFKAELSMEGRWQLSLAAKVQGEPETVLGKLILKVSK